MANIILPQRWQTKPPSGALINWAHPLALGMRLALLFPNTRDIVTQTELLRSGVPEFEPDSAVFRGASSGYIYAPDSDRFDGWGEQFSVFTDISLTGAQPDSGFGVIAVKNISTGNVPYGFFLRTAGLRLRLNTVADDASANFWDTSVALPTGTFQMAGYTWRTGEVPKCWYRGNEQSLSSSGGTLTGSLKVSDGILGVGNVNTVNFRLNARLRWLYFWSRALLPSEIQWLNAEPYAFIQPPAPYRRYIIPFVADSAAGAGSASGTGAAAGVGASIAIAPGAATGIGAASGAGASTAATAGAATGAGAAVGVGAATSTAAGSAAGAGEALGVGDALIAGDAVGAASGIGTATGAGASAAASAGAIAGTGTAAGAGVSIAAGLGSASGAAACLGVGNALKLAAGSAAGTSTVAAVGASIATGAGAASGAATAIGSSESSTVNEGAGFASASSTVLAAGASMVVSAGTAAGTAIVIGVGGGGILLQGKLFSVIGISSNRSVTDLLRIRSVEELQ